MNKKATLISIMIVLISMTLSSVAISSGINDEIKNTAGGRVTRFTSTPVISVDYDSELEEIIPNAGSQEMPLQVSYEITGLLAVLHEFRFRRKNVEVQLEIIEKPEWCEASLNNNAFNFKVKRSCSEPENASLSISVNENAPAFIKGEIKIKATSTLIKGLIFTKVAEGNATFEIPFSVGYLPLIDVSLSEGDYKEIPPLNTSTIPISITNLGNGETTVIINVKTNDSNTFELKYPTSVTIDPPLLGGEYKKEIEIEIYAYKNLSTETFVVELTPQHYSQSSLQGETTTIDLTIKNDGSYIEENGLEIDLTLILGIIAVIFLVLVLVFILRRKR